MKAINVSGNNRENVGNLCPPQPHEQRNLKREPKHYAKSPALALGGGYNGYGTAVMLLEANVGPQSKKEQTISLLGIDEPSLLIALFLYCRAMGMTGRIAGGYEDILDVIRGVIQLQEQLKKK